jgi:signal transduction histidine kinase
MRPSRLTIRARITGGSLLIAILISVVAGVVIYQQVRRIVTDGQVAILKSVEAPYITALTQERTGDVDVPAPGQLVAVVGPDGTVKRDTLPAPLSSQVGALAERDGTRSVATPDGSYLVRVTDVQTTDGSWRVITAASDEAQVSVLNQVAMLLIVSIAGINLAFGAASWLIGTAALAPVSRLRRSAEELVRQPGSELLPVRPAQDEIAQLAHTLNELIGELRASAERERQIVSDASHEFRTPLAIMTTQLELAQAEATTLPKLRRDVAAAQRTLERLTALATSMLELSRIDAQASPGRATVGQLRSELADAADRGRQRVGGRDIRIDYASDDFGDDAAEVRVSAADFGRVCDNLVNNALAASGATGEISLSLSLLEAGDTAVLAVSDAAGGMDAEFVPHAFDRFSRSVTSRSGSGAGLGLAIVEGIASLAGGSVRLENTPGMGLSVVVRFPMTDVGAGQESVSDPPGPHRVRD